MLGPGFGVPGPDVFIQRVCQAGSWQGRDTYTHDWALVKYEVLLSWVFTSGQTLYGWHELQSHWNVKVLYNVNVDEIFWYCLNVLFYSTRNDGADVFKHSTLILAKTGFTFTFTLHCHSLVRLVVPESTFSI